MRRIRNVIPPVYALLILGGFLISPMAGVIVLVVGGAVTGLLWSALSGRPPAADGAPGGHRADARAARRANR